MLSEGFSGAHRDPAVEAAQRAIRLDRDRWSKIVRLGPVDDDCVADFALDAAREALSPLQELHHRETVKATSCDGDGCSHEGDCPIDVEVPVCWECYRFASDEVYPYFAEENLRAVEWPCVTARLIYPEGGL